MGGYVGLEGGVLAHLSWSMIARSEAPRLVVKLRNRTGYYIGKTVCDIWGKRGERLT